MTSEFHRIHRELDKTATCSAGQIKRAHPERAKLERQLYAIGGRQAYQEASVLTTTRHRTCKWVFSVLTKQGLRPERSQPALKLLEVEAKLTDRVIVLRHVTTEKCKRVLDRSAYGRVRCIAWQTPTCVPTCRHALLLFGTNVYQTDETLNATSTTCTNWKKTS